jgi:SOS-response transcriptional repressor LexA
MTFCEKLADARKSRKLLQTDVLNELSKLGLQVTQTQLSRWERGKAIPPLNHFFALCSIYHIDNPLDRFSEYHKARLNEIGLRKVEEYTQDLIASGKYAPEFSRTRTLPLYLLPAAAGTGQLLDDDNYEMIDVDESVPESADYGIRVAGDSMEPRYHDGDILWVEKQEELDEDEIGVFFLNGDSYIKKLHLGKRGTQLISLNAEYAPIEIRPSDSFRVFGRVVG